MPFALTHAVLLAALGGLALPIALHLLMKQRQVRMKFSTVRFFDPQDPKAKSKRRLRNLLLLFLRIACFTLVVLAFTRPFLPSPVNASLRAPRQLVLVVDRSLSLQARDSTGSRWEQSLALARKAIGELTAEDRVALIALGTRAELVSHFGPPSVATAQLSELKPAHSASDLAEGLREAARVTGTATRGVSSTITLISDLQANAADAIGSVQLPAEVDVRILAVGDRAPFNAAVADLQLDPGETNRPFATLVTFGDEPSTNAAVEFLVDDRPLWKRLVALNPGGSTRIDLDLPQLAPGWHQAEVRIENRDALAADNRRTATFTVPPPIRVVLVEGRQGVRSFREQTFFLAAALDPRAGEAGGGNNRFTITRCSPAELPLALVPRADTQTNTSANPRVDALLVPAQRDWSPDAVTAMDRFIRSGGGAAFFVGDEAPAAAMNNALSELLPAQLLQTEGAEPESPWRIGSADRATAVFDAFRNPNSGNLAIAEFTRRFSLQPVPGSSVLARFDDGVPCLLQRTLGSGRVLLVNTTPDTAWSDWPKHKTFVPSIHGLVRQLARRTDDRLLTAPVAFAAGTEAVLPLGNASTQRIDVTLPDGSRTQAAVDSQGELRFDTTLPGVHRVAHNTPAEPLRFAVHTPNSESDLTGITAKQVERRLVRRDPGVVEPPGADLLGADSSRRELWRLLLLTAIALLLVETFVANRTAP